MIQQIIQVIINCIQMYLLIGTFVLMNLLFNPNIEFTLKDEEDSIRCMVAFYIALIWIIAIPKIILRRNGDDNNE